MLGPGLHMQSETGKEKEKKREKVIKSAHSSQDVAPVGGSTSTLPIRGLTQPWIYPPHP